MGFMRWKQAAPESRQLWHHSFEQNKFDMGLSAATPGAFLRQSLAAAVHWNDINGDKMPQAANEDAWTPVFATARS